MRAADLGKSVPGRPTTRPLFVVAVVLLVGALALTAMLVTVHDYLPRPVPSTPLLVTEVGVDSYAGTTR